MSLSEPFAAVPRRAFEALEAHELTLPQLALLAYLINRHAGGGHTSAKLSTIRAQVRWTQSDESLRQNLHELASKGWISVKAPNSGSTAPWSFGLLAAEITPRSLELSSKEAPGTNGVREEKNRDARSKEAPKPLDPQEVEVEVEDDVAVREKVLARIDALGPVPSQRQRWLANPQLTLAWLDDLDQAGGGINSEAAYIDAGVKNGIAPPARKPKDPKRRPLLDLLVGWVDAEGRHYARESVLDEIDRQERRRHERLTRDEREALLAHWAEVAEA